MTSVRAGRLCSANRSKRSVGAFALCTNDPRDKSLRFRDNAIVCDRIVAIKCRFDYARSRSMSLGWPGGSRSLAWSNPVARWWSFLALVSATNIAAFFLLCHYLQKPQTAGIELMLLLCGAYVFGCAFRSFLPRADVQRICLFDTWLSSASWCRADVARSPIAQRSRPRPRSLLIVRL
jgi:hypothetical protein